MTSLGEIGMVMDVALFVLFGLGGIDLLRFVRI